MNSRALIVEDDRSWQQILKELLTDAGLETDQVDNLHAAQDVISQNSHRVAIIDLSLAGADHNNRDGLQVMDYLQQHDPDCVMILLTGFATVEIAVTALAEKGALTCLRKELFQRGEFIELIQRALAFPSKVAATHKQKDLSLPEKGQWKEPAYKRGISILVVEDDAGWREILAGLLQEDGYVVHSSSSFGEALSLLQREKCDLAVIDLSLEGKSVLSGRRHEEQTSDFEGVRLLSTIKSSNIPTVVVSGEASMDDIEHVIHEQQIFAFIEKQTFDRTGFLKIIEESLRNSADRELFEKLTNREREVLELIYQGKTNKEIAENLVITPNTVKRHLKAIFEKLDIHTRSAAAVQAASWFGPNPGVEED